MLRAPVGQGVGRARAWQVLPRRRDRPASPFEGQRPARRPEEPVLRLPIPHSARRGARDGAAARPARRSRLLGRRARRPVVDGTLRGQMRRRPAQGARSAQCGLQGSRTPRRESAEPAREGAAAPGSAEARPLRAGDGRALRPRGLGDRGGPGSVSACTWRRAPGCRHPHRGRSCCHAACRSPAALPGHVSRRPPLAAQRRGGALVCRACVAGCDGRRAGLRPDRHRQGVARQVPRHVEHRRHRIRPGSRTLPGRDGGVRRAAADRGRHARQDPRRVVLGAPGGVDLDWRGRPRRRSRREPAHRRRSGRVRGITSSGSSATAAKPHASPGTGARPSRPCTTGGRSTARGTACTADAEHL